MVSHNPQNGFTVPVVIASVAIALALGGVIYYANFPKEADNSAEEKAMMEKQAMMGTEKDAMMQRKEIEIVLNAQNNSNQNGKAILTDINGKTKVAIEIKAGMAGIAQPAHIHIGSCPNPGTVKYPLQNLMDGRSETMLDVALKQLGEELPLAINVHKSGSEASTYVSCGDLPMSQFEARGADAVMGQGGEMMKQNEGAMEGAMMGKGGTDTMKYSGAMLAGGSAPLLDFAKADYDAAMQTDKLVVLYFYAKWCPICKAEFPIMQEVFNELTTDKVIGFRVNYNDDQTDSNEVALAKQFGVAYQHTKVFVKNGQRILKSPESWDAKRYVSEIDKALGQ